jgi:hypothetical protein
MPRTACLQSGRIEMAGSMQKSISDAVRRFVLTSLPTVPHLETLLLLWREPQSPWTAEQIAARLYVTPGVAATLADELCAAGLLQCAGEPHQYRCRTERPALAALLDELDQTYRARLREVTALIHSRADHQAARFAQAFSWRKKD